MLLPEGARLLHVGPYKTGTTAIQASLWAARAEMLAQGVRLAGRSRNPAAAVRAITGRPSPFADDGATLPMRRWKELAGEIRDARERRIVVSSEFFAWADRDVARRIVADIGSEGVHVAVTLRPLARIIPSMWQQNVQAGLRASFDDWLRGVLRQPPESATRAFWMLQRHDELVERWVDVLGPDHLTAIVVDERDHGFLHRVFEALLGLRDGTLKPQHELVNRSLTMPEAEAVRALNVAFHEEGMPKGLQARLIHYGAALVMKGRAPGPAEPRVELPGWAVEPTTAIQRDVVDGIMASGVRIIGDLDRLVEPVRGADTAANGSVAVSPEIAAALALGVVVASGEARRARIGGRRLQLAEPVEVARVPTYQLAGTVVLRGVRGALRGAAGGMDRVRGALTRRGGAAPEDG